MLCAQNVKKKKKKLQNIQFLYEGKAGDFPATHPFYLPQIIEPVCPPAKYILAFCLRDQQFWAVLPAFPRVFHGRAAQPATGRINISQCQLQAAILHLQRSVSAK